MLGTDFSLSPFSPPPPQVIKLLAQYKQAAATGSNAKEAVFGALQEFLQDEATGQDATVRLIAAQLYLEEGNFKEALTLVHDGETLEMMSLCVLIYLAMNRVDLAERQCKAMQTTDDDDTLTQACALLIVVVLTFRFFFVLTLAPSLLALS